MTQQFAARLGRLPVHSAGHRQVLASLPEHFRIVEEEAADAALWDGREKISPGPRVLILAGGGPKPLPDGPVVIPAALFVPRLMADAGFARARGTPFKLINAVGTADMRSSLALDVTAYLDLCACIRLLTARHPRIVSFTRTQNCLAATLSLEGTTTVVSLTVAHQVTGPDMTLDAVGDTLRLHARLDADAMARPAYIEINDEAGSSRAPLVHQNDRRLTWLAAHAVLLGQKQSLDYGLAERHEDATELQRAMGERTL